MRDNQARYVLLNGVKCIEMRGIGRGAKGVECKSYGTPNLEINRSSEESCSEGKEWEWGGGKGRRRKRRGQAERRCIGN